MADTYTYSKAKQSKYNSVSRRGGIAFGQITSSLFFLLVHPLCQRPVGDKAHLQQWRPSQQSKRAKHTYLFPKKEENGAGGKQHTNTPPQDKTLFLNTLSEGAVLALQNITKTKQNNTRITHTSNSGSPVDTRITTPASFNQNDSTTIVTNIAKPHNRLFSARNGATKGAAYTHT